MNALTSRDIENQLKYIISLHVDYPFAPTEYGKGVWRGIKAYFDMRKKNPLLIPTEGDFAREFINRTINLFPREKLALQYEKYKLGLETRARRAYRSLVREEHCIQRMKELYRDHGVEILHDDETDWKKGIDVILVDRVTDRVQFVHLFVDSPSSWRARKQKEKRGKGRDFSRDVDLPFNRKEGKKVGDFYLYSDKQIKKFLYRLRTEYKHKGVSIDEYKSVGSAS